MVKSKTLTQKIRLSAFEQQQNNILYLVPMQSCIWTLFLMWQPLFDCWINTIIVSRILPQFWGLPLSQLTNMEHDRRDAPARKKCNFFNDISSVKTNFAMHSLPSVVIYELYWQILWEVKMLSRKVFVIFQRWFSHKKMVLYLFIICCRVTIKQLQIGFQITWLCHSKSLQKCFCSTTLPQQAPDRVGTKLCEKPKILRLNKNTKYSGVKC